MPGFLDKKKRFKYVGEVRKSKITTSNGIGSLVDFPDFSGLMGGQNLWYKNFSNEMKIHDKRLEDYTGKDYFIQAASPTESTTKKTMGFNKTGYKIPIIRFPEYYYCPNCGNLDYVKNIGYNYKNDKDHVEAIKCNNCGNNLLPSRFVVSCDCGHLEEFPYAWWTHKNVGKTCEKPVLKIKHTSSSGGLESILLECATCGAKNSMANCLGKEALLGLKCRGLSPWLGKDVQENCGRNIRAIMRGSNNLYYSETVSALTIPPWSNGIELAIDKNYEFLNGLIKATKDSNLLKTLIQPSFVEQNISEIYGCDFNTYFEQVLRRFIKVDDPSEKTENALIHDEYKAFIGNTQNDYYFKTVAVQVSNDLLPYIDQVKLVNRLREVQVLTGFRRIEALGEDENEEDGVNKIAKLSTNRENWLPAVEMNGEGIFIEFNKAKMQEWLKKNQHKYDDIKGRFDAKHMYLRYGRFTPLIIPVHTISHLLMRELAYESGYDASSIKEKLYVDADDWMCGLLIYTSSSSSDGSFGGLVRQGKKEKLSAIIHSAIEKARWCSNDPICSESNGQGLYSLNNAACYACTLVPETSCTMFNSLLDRCSIIGKYDDAELGLMSDFI